MAHVLPNCVILYCEHYLTPKESARYLKDLNDLRQIFKKFKYLFIYI